MKFVEHKLATGAMLTGYLRDETTEMPSYNTRPAVLILPGGGYRYCSPREADPVAVQFLQAGYHVFTLIYSTGHAPLLWQPLTEAASANRVRFFNNIKNNDYDCVIMSHDQFGKIPHRRVHQGPERRRPAAHEGALLPGRAGQAR